MPDDQRFTERDKEEEISYWSTPASLRASPAHLKRVARNPAEGQQDCLLIGPSGAGKTSLLAALPRAATIGSGMSLVPGTSLTQLAAQTIRTQETGASIPPTGEPNAYDFQLRLTGTSNPSQENPEIEAFEIAVRDWPGSWLFPDAEDAVMEAEHIQHIEQFVGEALDATCLVLCVDAQCPRTDLWQAHLPPLLSRLARGTDSLARRLRPVERGFPAILSPQWELPFLRVLVLLTKIDLLCEQILELIGSAAKNGAARSPLWPLLTRLAGTGLDVALGLQPMRLAEELLGRNLLSHIHSALKPRGSLAVTLTSSLWLADSESASRQAVHGPDGVAKNEATVRGSLSPGFAESLLFLSNGTTRPPLVTVDVVDDVSGREDGTWLEIPL